jgi:hypothetical protein
MMDNFWWNSTVFKSHSWHTDILCILDGLTKLDRVPELTMSALISFENYTQAGLQEYLNVIIAWEHGMLAEGPSIETVRDLDISMDNEHSLIL